MRSRRSLPIAGVVLLALVVAPAGADPGPPTVTVDCATDSLQDAIDAATPGSTITLLPSVCHEDVTIEKDLVLVGTAGQSIIDGVGRLVVSVDSDVDVTLEGISITGGEAGLWIGDSATVVLESSRVFDNGLELGDPNWDGGSGGVGNRGTLTVVESVIENNWHESEGAGISNGGTLSVVDSFVVNNHVYDAGGGGGGGGIYNEGVAIVSGSSISDNDAEEDSGGNVLNNGTMSIESSTINGGFAQESGGIENWADLTLRDVVIANNAGTDIGAIANSEWEGAPGSLPSLLAERVTVRSNGVVDFPNYGGVSAIGAIENFVGTMEFRQSVIVDNVGGCVGAIANRGTLMLTASSVSDNSADGIGLCHDWIGNGGGVGVTEGSVVVRDTEIADNSSATDGGGILAIGGTALIENSTISGNTASWAGGGIRNSGGDVTVVSSTIADNEAMSFGGGTAGAIEIRSSIIGDNSAPTGPQCRGVVKSAGWNVVGDATGCNIQWLPSDVRNRDPKLAPLADNGGPTRTMRLRSASPARDVIPPSLCAVAADQRGVARPQGPGCDIGAFEVEVDPPACTIKGTPGDDVLIGTGGDDVICGRGGNDEIRGGGGDDLIFGGGGKDTIYGGAGDDVIDGGNHGDTLYGNAGDDTLLGGKGLDKLFGGQGIDVVDGGPHRDKLYGNAGSDTLASGLGHDGRVTGGGGADYLLGDAHRDRLIGGSEADRLEGHGGNDVLRGGDGNDTLDGGPGNDDVCGQAGDDVIIPSGGTDVTCPWG